MSELHGTQCSVFKLKIELKIEILSNEEWLKFNNESAEFPTSM